MNSDAPKLEPKPDLMPATAKDDPMFRPAAGGWAPGGWQKLVASCVTGAGSAVSAYLLSVQPGVALDSRHMVGIGLAGCFASAATYLGLSSAGTRKL
jgi:hypothetical protein